MKFLSKEIPVSSWALMKQQQSFNSLTLLLEQYSDNKINSMTGIEHLQRLSTQLFSSQPKLLMGELLMAELLMGE